MGKTKDMTTHKEGIVAFVKEKLSRRTEELKGAESYEDKVNLFADFDSLYSGAIEVLTAIGVDGEEFKAIVLAKDSNQKAWDALVQEQELEKLLLS